MGKAEEHFPVSVTGAKDADQLPVHAPYDGAIIGSVGCADTSVVEQALTQAYALFRQRSDWLPTWRRIEILNKAADIMEEEKEELIRGAAHEGGKPYIDSKVEVERAIDGVRGCVDVLRTEPGEGVPMGINAASVGRVALTMHEPIGVVVAVSAFNHPLNLIVHQVAPAIARGCPVIVKPAEDTPLSCFRFVQILHRAGLPESWCQALTVKDLKVATALVTDSRVAFFSFIGSARVGWLLRSQLAAGTRCSLEHGGAAPVIMAEDADIDTLCPMLAKGGFYHAGQVCVSVQRIFAHKSIALDVARRLGQLAKQQKIGDPLSSDTTVGPLIRHAEVDRVEEWVNEAEQQGTEVVAGGERLSASCYPCTVLYDPPADARVSCQEIFGPVICVYPYTDYDDAIQRANSLPFAFQASVCSQDIDRALRLAKGLDASTVMINDHTAFRVDWMPFAGLRQSGLGVGGIPHTMRDMRVDKTLILHSPSL